MVSIDDLPCPPSRDPRPRAERVPDSVLRRYEAFLDRLRSRRLALGFTQERLAQRLGVTVAQLANIERGGNVHQHQAPVRRAGEQAPALVYPSPLTLPTLSRFRARAGEGAPGDRRILRGVTLRHRQPSCAVTAAVSDLSSLAPAASEERRVGRPAPRVRGRSIRRLRRRGSPPRDAHLLA